MASLLPAKFLAFDFQSGNTLLQAIGSFWAQIFGERDRLEFEFLATGEVFMQTQMDFLEAVATVSRFELPVFHRERFHLLILKQSSLVASSRVLQYGEESVDAVHGQQPSDASTFLYGEPAFERFVFDIKDERLADDVFIMNRIIDPSVVLAKGIDFKIDRDTGTIQFDQDPFDNVLFSRRPVYGENNEVVDEELALWLFQGDFDKDFVFNHFGYALQVAASQSSEFYKDFVNAYWNTFTRTPTLRDIRFLLTAMSGVPTVLENQETVEFIIPETAGKLQIITDQHVYKFKTTATPVVAVGDVLKAGDDLVDAVQLIELSSSNSSLDGIPALGLNRNFLSGGYFSHLIFENRPVTLDYLGIDEDNKAVVQFDVGGFVGDVDLFWELALQRGKDMGATLAELLDTRENPPTDPSLPPEITQPGPEHLPETINPLQFVVDNLLKNNMFIIKLKPADTDPLAAGLEFFHVMRAAIPPHTTFVVFVETPDLLDEVDLGQQGGIDQCLGIDDDEPGVQDESFNDQDTCTSVPLINVFDGPSPGLLEEVGVTDPLDGTAWLEEAMVRPRLIQGELL